LDSGRKHIDKAVSRYSSLFALPSYRNTAASLLILCMIVGFATVLSYGLSLHGVILGLVLIGLLSLASFFGDYLTVRFLLGEDPIMNLRRCSFLSLSSNAILFVFALAANLASASLGNPSLWIKVLSIGLFASLILRYLVFYVVSFANPLGVLASSMTQPALFLAVISVVPIMMFGFGIYHLIHFSVAVLAAVLAVRLFTAFLDVSGKRALGVPSINLFRAFLANWAEGLNEPFEKILEQLGEEHDIDVSILAFKTERGLKAAIVIPNLHPGPFKNVGSSPLPGMIQEALEKKLGCVVSVPHGISGHELDLASQIQNEKFLSHILSIAEFDFSNHYATPFVRLEENGVSASCQIFGDHALLTLTLAPKTMEDLPPEINEIVIREAKRMGLTSAVAIDAHNSIEGPFNPEEEVIAPARKVIMDVSERALGYERSRFDLGAAKVVPREFGVKEGMGPGGISVIVTNDGNNMVSNLREEILSSLGELGIIQGEILTTDTHVVNGVVMTERGYHPIGEAIDHERLIDYIKETTADALKDLEPAEASWRQETIHGIKIIGERQIDDLCLLVEKVANQAKKMSVILFSAFSIALISIFTLL